MAISTGATASQSFTVGEADTASALGSGDVPVLATPRIIAWCEAVTVLAVSAGLDSGQTTVGFKIRIDHLAPTPVGGDVTCTATVTGVDGRQVTLDVEANDRNGPIVSGTIVRVVVDRDKFVNRAQG